jgi:hypothetical protein
MVTVKSARGSTKSGGFAGTIRVKMSITGMPTAA